MAKELGVPVPSANIHTHPLTFTTPKTTNRSYRSTDIGSEGTDTNTTAIMADTVRHYTPRSRSKCIVCSQWASCASNHLPNRSRRALTSNMTSTQADLPERKPRKSVAFSEGATIVDSNGDVTESKDINGGKSSAESHASGPPTPPGEHTLRYDTNMS